MNPARVRLAVLRPFLRLRSMLGIRRSGISLLCARVRGYGGCVFSILFCVFVCGCVLFGVHVFWVMFVWLFFVLGFLVVFLVCG